MKIESWGEVSKNVFSHLLNDNYVKEIGFNSDHLLIRKFEYISKDYIEFIHKTYGLVPCYNEVLLVPEGYNSELLTLFVLEHGENIISINDI